MFSCLSSTKTLRVLAFAASLAAGAVIWPGAPALAQGSAFQSGSWAGSAYGNPEGKFERCVITSEFPGKPVLGFGREVTGKFEIWLVNAAWQYSSGANELVTISIDGSTPRTGNFLAIGPDRIATQLPPSSPLIDGLKRGSRLKMTFGGVTHEYPLKGTFNAITALDNCAQNRGVKVANTAKPKAPSAADQQAQAEKALRMLAAVEGDTLFKLSSGDFAARVVLADPDRFRVPEDLQDAKARTKADFVWTVEDGFGIAKGVPGSPTEEDLRAGLVGLREKGCLGELTSSADMRISAVKDRIIKRVDIGCSKDSQGNPAYEAFSFYPHDSGNLIMIVHFTKSPESSKAADDAFFKIVEAVAGAS
jgi:hypothetical protein